MNEKSEAVEAEIHAHPVEVADYGITLLEPTVKNVVYVDRDVIVTDNCDTSVSCSTTDHQATNPHVVSEQAQNSWVINR